MKRTTTRIAVIISIGLALVMPVNRAFADADSEKSVFEESESFKTLSAEWWQWALSIPTPENPQLDTTGENGVIGQHGPVWFLAGFFGGGTVTRTCFVPDSKVLFFPLINQINFNTPNVCGQGPENLSISDMRALSADFVDGATNLSVTVDGKPIKNVRRVQSKVFEVALPKENVFDSLCASFGGVPAGVYSPAVDDGFYVLLHPLPAGTHALHFHAENPAQGFVQDVTYTLKVVAVSLPEQSDRD